MAKGKSSLSKPTTPKKESHSDSGLKKSGPSLKLEGGESPVGIVEIAVPSRNTAPAARANLPEISALGIDRRDVRVPRKRIIICIDGTWSVYAKKTNERLLEDTSWTNVQKIRTLIAERGDMPQVVFYTRGIGTSDQYYRNLIDGAIANGLDEQLLDAYMTLCDNYEEGDEIFLIGFSRGATAVRALAGMIAHCGILKADMVHFIKYAWLKFIADFESQFKDLPEYNVAVKELPAMVHPESSTKIKSVAVWDTVFGVESEIKKSIGGWAQISATIKHSATSFRFKHQVIHEKIEHAFHAMAIDERRNAFQLVPWTKSDTRTGGTIKQVWFAGTHANVGGGCRQDGIANISLHWMIRQLESIGLVFHHAEADRTRLYPPLIGDSFYNSLSGAWRKAPSSLRQIKVFDSNSDYASERIHASALALCDVKNRIWTNGDGTTIERSYQIPILESNGFKISRDKVEDESQFDDYCNLLRHRNRIEFL